MTEEALPRGRIVFDGTRTPVKTALFLLVCLAWLLPGLVGHDPWKVDEALVFGAVAEMLRSGDWVVFRVAGEPLFEGGPLSFWASAASAKAFGAMLPLHDAARLPAGLFMGLTLALLGLTCLELLGERGMRVGVLLLIGCLGLLIRAHEMSPDIAAFAGIALALYGLALALRRPVAGGAVAGVGAGAAFLGNGLLPLGMVLLTLALLPLAGPAWRTRRYAATAAVALLAAAPLVALWPALLAAADPALVRLWLENAGGGLSGAPVSTGRGMALAYFLKTLPWYAWPAWPLAGWTLWRMRRSLAERPELLLPLTAFVAFFVAISVFGEAREVNAMPLLIPLAVLGVAEIDSLPRGAASALDWFGMTTFLLLATLVWIGWVAALTGKPQFAAAWLESKVPGYDYPFSFVAFALAALLSLIWLVVVARSLRSTRRALVNWTAGITMVWMLVMTLGVPIVDQARSYRELAARVVEALPPGFTCVARLEVGDAQRALLDYFANLQTLPVQQPAASRCRVLLGQGSRHEPPEPGAGWTEIWRGSRPGDRNEYFVLFARSR